MTSQFDVAVVGARCAGSPLATLLAREGLEVVVVERATFPRDTLSTHIFEADGLAFLDRLGLTDRLRGTGAPFMGRAENRTGDFHWSAPWPTRPADPGGMVSIRRFVLDPILAEAAEEAGAEVRMGTKVTGLVTEDGRVSGVRTDGAEGEQEIRARLVVGADGRNSTVARLAGARKYNVVPSEHALYWGYFEGARLGEPTFVFHKWDSGFVVGCPTDGGLYQVQAFVPRADLAGFRRDLEASFMEHATRCAPVAEAIEGSRRVGKLLGMVRWEGFFRDAAGPGWVLAGDAGHFKDPAPGRGIGDAFMQAERLAPAIASEMGASPAAIDGAMGRFGRWRDEEFAEHYWFAADLGAADPVPAPLIEMLRRLDSQGQGGTVLEINNHRLRPSQVLTPPRALRATARALARPGADRRAVLRELRDALAGEMRRRWLRRRPEYVDDPQAHADAGPTEVEGMERYTVKDR
jgi:flavin-dependent dehydrogenase